MSNFYFNETKSFSSLIRITYRDMGRSASSGRFVYQTRGGHGFSFLCKYLVIDFAVSGKMLLYTGSF